MGGQNRWLVKPSHMLCGDRCATEPVTVANIVSIPPAILAPPSSATTSCHVCAARGIPYNAILEFSEEISIVSNHYQRWKVR